MKTAGEFYEEQRRIGNTIDITSNEYPDYSLPFYQAIFRLIEEYASHPPTEGEIVDVLVEDVGPTDKEMLRKSKEGWPKYNERILKIAKAIKQLIER